mgnify:CR=1 FL=1
MADIFKGVISNLFWALIAAAATWLWARRKIGRLRQQLRAFQTERGDREVVLIFSAREDITEAVNAQLMRDGRQLLPKFKLHHPGSFSDQESEWMAYVHKMKDQVKKIREHGATRIYFFTNLPVVMGTFAGALLHNGPEVIVHHHFSGVYRRIGTITHETVYY